MSASTGVRVDVLVRREAEVPLWARQVLARLADEPGVELRLRWLAAATPAPTPGRRKPGWLARIPALNPATVPALPADATTPADVVVALDAATASALATIGADDAAAPRRWLLGDAQGRALDAELPGFDSIVSALGLSLHVWQQSPEGPQVQQVRQARVLTPPAYARAIDSLGWHAGLLLCQCVRELMQLPAVPQPHQPTVSPAATRRAAAVGTARLLAGRAKGSWRDFIQQQRAKWLSEYWRIGCMDVPASTLLQDGRRPAVRWITDADGSGYWADPIGHPTNPRILFCEYFDERTGLGQLERLTLDDTGHVVQRAPLDVSVGRHSSFPTVTPIDGRLVGLAETAALGECILHDVDAEGRWHPIASVLHGVRAADPALFQWEGRYWLALTDMAYGELDNLCLYHAEHLTGPWTPHANNPVKVDITSARMAGPLFRVGEQLLRPAQNCLQTYGSSVVIHRIARCTPTEFIEEPVTELLPQEDGVCPDGLHTFSWWHEKTLIDGKRHRVSLPAVYRKLRRRWPWSETRRDAAPDAALGASGRVGIYIPHLRMGGGEMSLLRLAGGFAAMGLAVDLIVHRRSTAELDIPAGVHVIELETDSSTRAVRKLVGVLRERQPQWLLSAFPHTNIASVAAVRLAGIDCRCVISEHAPLQRQIEREPSWRYKALPPLVRWAYRRADAVVAVSEGVRQDLQDMLGDRHLPLSVIHNPVLQDAADDTTTPTPPHPWLLDRRLRVLMSASRLSVEKDIPTLIRAFERMHRVHPDLRLIVAGEGPDRARLEALVAERRLTDVVALPGRVIQPQTWMRHAAVFALASEYEGFGNALIEAMASGVPVVSTDCPVGPREILDNGRHGDLVPVGDDASMAQALLRALERGGPPPGAKDFADRFTVAAACTRYRQLFDSLRRAHA